MTRRRGYLPPIHCLGGGRVRLGGGRVLLLPGLTRSPVSCTDAGDPAIPHTGHSSSSAAGRQLEAHLAKRVGSRCASSFSATGFPARSVSLMELLPGARW